MTTTRNTSTNRLAVSGLRPSEAAASSDLVRIRKEYLEMPGLVLTLAQAARLWGFSVRRSERLLSVLVDAGFLVRDEVSDHWRRRGSRVKGETE